MKLKYLFIGSMIGCGGLTACQDQLDFNEYANYDKNYMMESYENVGGLVTSIYAQLDSDWGNYGELHWLLLVMRLNMRGLRVLFMIFIMVLGALRILFQTGARIIWLFSNVICIWRNFWD